MVYAFDRSREGTAREEALGRFLRERRLRLAPESRVLGGRPRLSMRVGKLVTQEEAAEHLEISRNWYARFEGGGAARFSTSLLTRLCDLLLLSSSERVELMRLAMPELATVVSRDASALYVALHDVRKVVKRFWTASSEAEILVCAGEEARRMLPDPDLIFVHPPLHVALDESLLFQHRRSNIAARFGDARAELSARWTPEQVGRMDTLIARAGAGEILRFEHWPRDVVEVFNLVGREYGLAWDSVIGARISRANDSLLLNGISSQARDVTEIDRAVISAIAEFASLALRD
jgi:transcriptional regulator with XRE-family HTH domain